MIGEHMSDFKHINIIQDDLQCEIVLNRPPLNILNIEMMKELNSVFKSVKKNENLRLLSISAEGKVFSAGADVAEHTEEKVEEMMDEFLRMFELLNEIKCPTLAVVKGSALGGGCELALFCDMVVASEKAKFGQPEIMVGVYPPVSVVIFPYLIGRNRSIELLIQGKSVKADEADRIGLINKAVPEDQFDEYVQDFKDQILDKSPVVLGITKKIIDKALYLKVEEGLEKAKKVYLEKLMKTKDANEGLEAFLEKRKPEWSGK